MDLSRFGSSVTITPILAVRNTATTTNLSPPAPFTEEAEVIVVEVEPDFIAEEDSSEEDEEDDEEEGEDETRDEEAISMTQTVRYRYARISTQFFQILKCLVTASVADGSGLSFKILLSLLRIQVLRSPPATDIPVPVSEEFESLPYILWILFVPTQCCGAGPFLAGSGFFFTGSGSGSRLQLL